MKTLIIGEPGCTAEGDYETYLRLLQTAADCGCSVWKPQWTSDAVAMCERRHILVGPRAEYETQADYDEAVRVRAYYERAYRWLQFPLEWHAEFRDRCHALGMQYACTTFLAVDVARVHPFVDYHKVSSFESRAQDMRAAHAEFKRDKPVFISTGMTADHDYSSSPSWGYVNLIRFHCVSAYPAPLSELNLAVIRWLDDGNPDYRGYSDHSRHLRAGAYAVAAGAEYIETHYRLDDCNPDNPDYAVAFTPAEFTEYINYIREAEIMMGTACKQVQPSESWALPYRV